MKKYLGVKIVSAEPMTFYENAGFEKGKKPLDGGVDRDGYRVVYEDGYTSWSPKDVFDKAYRRVYGLTFGLAIEALKQGKKVARNGWNGKGMWLLYISGHPCNDAGSNDMGDGIQFYDELESEMELLPWIGMKTADNKFVPWLASQTDMLAEDWRIVD